MTVRIETLTAALKNSYPGSETGKVEEIAHTVLDYFGYSDYCLSNQFETDIRMLFYELEDMGIMDSEIEEIELMTHVNWRIQRFKLNVFRINMLAAQEEKATGVSAYEDLPLESFHSQSNIITGSVPDGRQASGEVI
ncbi:MAG: DUF6015 family protein [Thermoplasmataceae archaeon]